MPPARPSEWDGADIVGLANRLHGNLYNEGLTVPVPSLEGVIGDGPAFMDAAVGDTMVEVFAGWGVVLASTGIYLWWPRLEHCRSSLHGSSQHRVHVGDVDVASDRPGTGSVARPMPDVANRAARCAADRESS